MTPYEAEKEREEAIREACQLARLTAAFMGSGSLTPAEWIREYWKPIVRAAGPLPNRECAGFGQRKHSRRQKRRDRGQSDE